MTALGCFSSRQSRFSRELLHPLGRSSRSPEPVPKMRRMGCAVSGALVAIDGAFFHEDASKASIVTRKRLTEQLAALEREIEAYEGRRPDRPGRGGSVALLLKRNYAC